MSAIVQDVAPEWVLDVRDWPTLTFVAEDGGRKFVRGSDEILRWLAANDAAPDGVYRVERVIVDLPCLKLFEFYRDAAGNLRLDPETGRALVNPPRLVLEREPLPQAIRDELWAST